MYIPPSPCCAARLLTPSVVETCLDATIVFAVIEQCVLHGSEGICDAEPGVTPKTDHTVSLETPQELFGHHTQVDVQVCDCLDAWFR